MRSRRRWGPAVLVAAAGLLGLAAVAAEGRPLSAARSNGTFRLGTGWVVLLGGLAALLFIAALVFTVWSIFVTRDAPTPARARKRSQLRALLFAAAAVLFLLALGDVRATDDQPKQPSPGIEDPAEPEPTGQPERPPLWPVAVLGSVVVAALAAALVSGRRRTVTRLHEAVPAEIVVDAFSSSLDALVDDPDPRAAIVAAYRALLAGLASAGLARRAAEAPHEHLRRALLSIEVRPEPMEELLSLYDEARFSDHPLTQAHRSRALAAFATARDDLRVRAG